MSNDATQLTVRGELLQLIRERVFRQNGLFRTPTRVVSSYFDFYQVSMKHRGIELAGELLYREIKDLEICALGNAGSGIVPVQCRAAFLKGIGVFFIRESMKKEGDVRDPRWLQSRIQEGDRVALTTDVVTSGSQVMRGLEEVMQFGAHVEKVIIMIDSEFGDGVSRIREFIDTNMLGTPVQTLFTRSEIMAGPEAGYFWR
jgi:orotate phosphoribosyltransferase